MTSGSNPDLPLQEKLNAEQLALVLRGIDALPTLPAVAARLLELTAQAQAAGGVVDVEELANFLSCDPALTANILARANRDSHRAPTTLGQSLQVLGAAEVTAIALQAPVFKAQAGDMPDALFDPTAFWRHCLAVACATGMIVERMGLAVDRETAFACGLLHDLGKLAALHCMPKSYHRVLVAAGEANDNIADHERRILGIDHTTLGRRLAEQWRLPLLIQQAIWLHHQPFDALPDSLEDRHLVAAVGLADTLARQQQLGFSGNHTFPVPALQQARALGLDEPSLERIAQELPAELAARSAVLGLDQLDSEGLYRQALASANAELATLNGQLRKRGAVLEEQARALELLREFTADLAGDATTADVLLKAAAILAAAASAAPSPAQPVIAYSIGESAQLVAVQLNGGAPVWRTLRRRGGELSVAPTAAVDALANLLEYPGELNEWIEPSQYRHLPLVCAKRWIGGVFLPMAIASGEEIGPAETATLEQTVANSLALALAIVQGRARAVLLGEQLAGAGEVLAAAQDALAEAKTLSAVGEMAAGAAHELNTPLAVISGRAQLMLSRAKGEEDRKVWKTITDQAQRLSDIITELMEFASPAAPSVAPVDVQTLLAEAKDVFSSSHPKAALSKVDIEHGPVLTAMADRGQILTVLSELMNNAALACDHPVIHLRAQADPSGDAVVLSVSDEGPGMDDATLSKAFTPFFSSQPAGRRRGLGLPRSRRYVENSGGRIWIRSRVGEGTTVFVQLPPAS